MKQQQTQVIEIVLEELEVRREPVETPLIDAIVEQRPVFTPVKIVEQCLICGKYGDALGYPCRADGKIGAMVIRSLL